jgi:UDP-N-acetylmuramoyl-tripeptide--D-alanyl-D-alanine ligase
MRTIEMAREEKAVMVRSMGTDGVAILNADDPNVRWMAQHARGRVITYGFGASADYRGTAVEVRRAGTSFTLTCSKGSHPVSLRLMGVQMVYPALAAAAAAAEQRIPMEKAIAALAGLPPTPQRLEPIALPDGRLIVDDSCQSGYETYEVALQTLQDLPADRRLLVGGDLTEPLHPQGPQYRELGQRMAAVVDRALYVGEKKAFNRIRAGARDAGMDGAGVEHVMADLPHIARILSSTARSGDVVLIKGRRVQHLERISLLLQGVTVRCSLTLCRALGHCRRCPQLQSPSAAGKRFSAV